VLSDIRMLRDFGLVTLIDLSVSLVGVLVALPAALVIAERSQPVGLPDRLAEAATSLSSAFGGGARRLRSTIVRLKRRVGAVLGDERA
jgi:uncharacterized protein